MRIDKTQEVNLIFEYENTTHKKMMSLIDFADSSLEEILEDMDAEMVGCEGGCCNESRNFCECGGNFYANAVFHGIELVEN